MSDFTILNKKKIVEAKHSKFKLQNILILKALIGKTMRGLFITSNLGRLKHLQVICVLY